MKRKDIAKHLTNNPSYFKWSAERLAVKFGCSFRTMKQVLNSLEDVKRNYLRSLSY